MARSTALLTVSFIFFVHRQERLEWFFWIGNELIWMVPGGAVGAAYPRTLALGGAVYVPTSASGINERGHRRNKTNERMV